MDNHRGAEAAPAPVDPARERYYGATYVGLAALAALLPFVPAFVPTQDGPQQVRLSAFLIELRADPQSPLRAVYHDALGPVTGSLFTWFTYLLHPLLRVETSERLWLSLCIAAFAAVGWLLCRAAHPQAPARALLLTPFFLNGFVTFGFFPYLASVPLAAGAAWLLLRPTTDGASSSRQRWARAVLASPLLALCCLGHISSLMLALGVVLLLALMQQRSVARLLPTALAFVPALLLAVHSSRVLALTPSGHQTPISDFIELLSPAQALGELFGCSLAGVSPLDLGLQGAALVLALGLLGLSIYSGEHRRWPHLVLALLGAGLLVLPSRYKGWHYASARVIPFMLLLLPATAWWPRAGSRPERWLAGAAALLALGATLSIGLGWRGLGQRLEVVAGAASVLTPGARVLPLTFAPGAEAPPAVRAAGRSLHAWALPTRLARAMVPFGFENMRRLMIVARADARPPFPPGPDEFAASVLWDHPPERARIFADYGFYAKDITDTARFLLPGIADPAFYEALRTAVLHKAEAGFHYVLAIDAPPRFQAQARARGWPCLYQRQGVYVYRMPLSLSTLVLPYGADR